MAKKAPMVAVKVGDRVLHRCPQLRTWVGARLVAVNDDGTLTLRETFGSYCIVTVEARRVRPATLERI